MGKYEIRDVTLGHCKMKDDGGPRRRYKWDIVWPNVVLLSFLHVGALYGIYLRPEAKIQSLIFYKVQLFLLTVGITGGAHRLWSHRCYTANTVSQIILMLMSSLTYQNSIYVWCRDHRLHHRFTETDADPHNAKRGFFFCHMGWLLVRKHEDVIKKGKVIDMTDLESNPVVMFQHRYYYQLILLITVFIPAFVPWYFWNESLQVSIFTLTIYRYVVSVHHTWFINSLAHLYGNKPYDKNIGPTENPFMMHFGYGEGFHNYHHTFPWDYKAAELGSDTRNPTTLVIDLFAWLGWVTNRKTVPGSVVDKRIRATGDGTYKSEPTNVVFFGVKIKRSTLENLKNSAIFFLYYGLVM